MNSFYNAAEYGAVGDGQTNNTAILRGLTKKIAAAGGGTLFFPAGRYLTGTVELFSNMELYIGAGAELLGSGDRQDYPMVDSGLVPGWGHPMHAGLVFALNAENVSLRGPGTINGQGWNWWNQIDLERPRAVQLIGCNRVSICGLQVINSPMWTLHPVCCDNVTIHNVSIRNPWDSPNTDGINPESCSNVRISDCFIDVGDDCVTLKSGTQDDPYLKKYACENIVITNCTMAHGHGGVVIGSEMSGGVRNVVISNCVFQGTDRGLRIKTRRFRGGTVEDVLVSNVLMDDVLCPVVFNAFYRCGVKVGEQETAASQAPQPVTEGTPVFRNFHFSNLMVKNASAAACLMEGLPEMPIDGVVFDQFTVSMMPGAEPEEPAMTFAQEAMAGRGLVLRNVRNVTLRGVRVTGASGPVLEMAHCEAVRAEGFSPEQISVSDCREIEPN